MIHFSIVFFCTAGLFLSLLEDRFRVWTTVGATACVYVLSLAAAFLLRRTVQDSALAGQLSCAAGGLLFFASSLPLYTNNPLQKFFLALLAQCNFTFLEFFLPLLLGILPFPVAGAFAGVFSILCYLLFTLLMGLCLYRPVRHFSDRGPSGFLWGMCLLLFALYALCLGRFDFLFRTYLSAARLLWAVLLYGAVVFGFRSLYHAGRFREKADSAAVREKTLKMEFGGFDDMLASVREVRAAQKAGEYALDTISVMLADGYSNKIPEYIAIAKKNSQENPILHHYHNDPLVNAVIAAKAAFAAQNDIAFSCNAVTGDAPAQTAELCMIANEILTRACGDAAAYDGERKLRFTIFPADNLLRFEAVYSARLPKPEKFTWKGKKAADIARWLFDDSPAQENHLHGLENTAEIIDRCGGKLTLSETGQGEVILQADWRI